METIIHLYIKTHEITKLKYFGKTTKDPFKYIGSGIHWKRHLKLHGNLVKTEILGSFTDATECSKVAIEFSIENDIVNSTGWANMINENGLDGAPQGIPKEKHTDATKKLISESSKKLWQTQSYRDKTIASHKQRFIDNPNLGKEIYQKGLRSQIDNNTLEQNRLKSAEALKQYLINRTEKECNDFYEFARKPKTKDHKNKISNALQNKAKSDAHKKALALSKQSREGVLVDHEGIHYEVHRDFLKKYSLNEGFLDKLYLPIRYREIYGRLGLDYESNKHKTKQELGFRFELEVPLTSEDMK